MKQAQIQGMKMFKSEANDWEACTARIYSSKGEVWDG